jgi:hypothetical protein
MRFGYLLIGATLLAAGCSDSSGTGTTGGSGTTTGATTTGGATSSGTSTSGTSGSGTTTGGTTGGSTTGSGTTGGATTGGSSTTTGGTTGGPANTIGTRCTEPSDTSCPASAPLCVETSLNSGSYICSVDCSGNPGICTTVGSVSGTPECIGTYCEVACGNGLGSCPPGYICAPVTGQADQICQ